MDEEKKKKRKVEENYCKQKHISTPKKDRRSLFIYKLLLSDGEKGIYRTLCIYHALSLSRTYTPHLLFHILKKIRVKIRKE